MPKRAEQPPQATLAFALARIVAVYDLAPDNCGLEAFAEAIELGRRALVERKLLRRVVVIGGDHAQAQRYLQMHADEPHRPRIVSAPEELIGMSGPLTVVVVGTAKARSNWHEFVVRLRMMTGDVEVIDA